MLLSWSGSGGSLHRGGGGIYETLYHQDFFCVGVMYSGEYDACDVTLSVYPQRASLKNHDY
jgi:hypothetical protein